MLLLTVWDFGAVMGGCLTFSLGFSYFREARRQRKLIEAEKAEMIQRVLHAKQVLEQSLALSRSQLDLAKQLREMTSQEVGDGEDELATAELMQDLTLNALLREERVKEALVKAQQNRCQTLLSDLQAIYQE